MSRYIVLAQSETTASAVTSWLPIFANGAEALEKPARIVWDRFDATGERAIETYKSCTNTLELALADRSNQMPLREVIALVDYVNPLELNVVSENMTWSSLIAMLILTFPEIFWVFCLTPQNKIDSTDESATLWSNIETEHSPYSLFRDFKRCPLFDPTGLRDWVRKRTNDALLTFDDLVLPERSSVAASIDEEEAYAFLNGFSAYRFGYRADVISSWSLMKSRFSRRGDHGYRLLLEDMSLNFPDKPNDVHLLSLENRAIQCPQLDSQLAHTETSDHRILITTGQTRLNDDSLFRNQVYLKTKSACGRGSGKVVFKPASGMFGLWRQAGLLNSKDRTERTGFAASFAWPPPRLRTETMPGGHGAPGKLLLVAEMLLHRAEILSSSIKSIEDAVFGAVLATDALELTGGRTPTTAIDALYLKHVFEMEAECTFSGVQYHLEIQSRLKEIAAAARQISGWYAPSQSRRAKLNAEMVVIYGLVETLENHSQFDEQRECMNRVRHLHNALWMSQRFFRYLLFPLLIYIEVLLSSFAVFISILVLWIAGLSILFYIANSGYGHLGYSSIGAVLVDAVSSFFSAGPPLTHKATRVGPDIPWRHAGVVCLAIVSGFTHMGVFITHLYAMISRK